MRRKIIVILLVCSGIGVFLFVARHNGAYAQNRNFQRQGRWGGAQADARSNWQNNGRSPREQGGNSPESGDDSAAYQIIIENNLFRPLGWQRPNREPNYVLIGTWIQSNGAIAKALVMERRSNQLYYVSAGEKVGNATVEKIEPNQVTLNTSGNTITLKAESMQFLNGTGGGRGPSPREGPPPAASPPRPSENFRGQNQGNPGGNAQGAAADMRERFRNASPEERRRMIEEFRQRGGRGGDVRFRRR